MSIYITGDTHGTFDLRKVVYFFKGREEEFNRDDYLIICGDVGVCGFMASDEAKTRDILRNLPVTVLFVDGNHENFEQLNSYAVETCPRIRWMILLSIKCTFPPFQVSTA